MLSLLSRNSFLGLMGNSVRKLSGASSLQRKKSEGQLSTNILQKDQYRLLADTLKGKQEEVHCDILKQLGWLISSLHHVHYFESFLLINHFSFKVDVDLANII